MKINFISVISPKEDAFLKKNLCNCLWFIPWKVAPSSFQVSHGKIIEGGKLKVVCPAGSAGEGTWGGDVKGEGGGTKIFVYPFLMVNHGSVEKYGNIP